MVGQSLLGKGTSCLQRLYACAGRTTLHWRREGNWAAISFAEVTKLMLNISRGNSLKQMQIQVNIQNVKS